MMTPLINIHIYESTTTMMMMMMKRSVHWAMLEKHSVVVLNVVYDSQAWLSFLLWAVLFERQHFTSLHLCIKRRCKMSIFKQQHHHRPMDNALAQKGYLKYFAFKYLILDIKYWQFAYRHIVGHVIEDFCPNCQWR